jgi:hypothetical protein
MMAEREEPPIIATAVAAWRDAFRAIGAMPVVAGIGFALLVAMALVEFWIGADPYSLWGSRWLGIVGAVSGIVEGGLLAPLAIAVHRYVLLGEVTRRYPLDPSSPRYWRFLGYAILLNAIWFIPGIVQGLTPDIAAAPMWLNSVVVVLFIAIIVVAVRRAILFPAIAVDAPGASWSNARRDTQGSSWGVAFILFCTLLPVVILLVPLVLLKPQLGGGHRLAYTVVSAVPQFLILCVLAAAASHIYRALANDLARGAAPRDTASGVAL